MPDPVIDTPVTEASAAPAAAAEPAVDAKALQSEIDRLRGESSEKDNAIRYWHEQAKGKQPATAAQPQPVADAEEDPLEVLSKRGAKGLDELLEKRGFVRKADVDNAVNQKAAIIAVENELWKEYPELKDKTSDFFKETAGHYQQLKASGVPEVEAMRTAADRAELAALKSGKRFSAAEKEEREARAKAQGGGKQTKAAAADPDESTALDDFQKYICEVMEITEDQYIARAKQGVTVRNK